MKIQTVVMRHSEDISWTDYLEDVVIYNKGNKTNSKHKVVNLPNLGMYHGSQLYHIIKNYYNLADITWFIQGHPFDGDLETHHKWGNNKNDIFSMRDYYTSIPNGEYMSRPPFNQHIGNKYISPPNYNQRHHGEFIKYTADWKEWTHLLDPYNKIDWNVPIRFYRNGHSGITKEAILSNPIEYYIMLIDHWRYSNPVAEWNTESSQNFIFNVDNSGKLFDFGHNDFDFSNNKDYNEWIYEI